MPSVWATQILPDYCQSEKLCQNKCPAKAQGTASLNLWKACTTIDTWTNWVSHVEFRPTLSPIVLMKLGNALRWCEGEKLAWAAARATDSTIHIQSGCLQVRVTCETKLAQIQAPNTHLRPEECNSAPVGPAPAANPLHLQSTCSLHTDWPHSRHPVGQAA